MNGYTRLAHSGLITWTTWLGFVAFAMVVALAQVATADQKGGNPGKQPPQKKRAMVVQPAAACPALFGGSGLRAANALTRARQLDFIEEDDSGITIAHCVESWEEPNELRFSDLSFVGVRGGAAIFEISPRLAATMGCRAGQYALEVDDAISRESRVLAVLRHAVLVEQRGALRYLLAPGEQTPQWLTAWRLQGSFGPTFDPNTTYTPPPAPTLY